MRRRLTLALVGSVTAALVLAGLGTLLLARVDARHDTRQELATQIDAVAALLAAPLRDRPLGDRPPVADLGRALQRRLAGAFRLAGVTRVVVTADGAVVGTLPDGVDAADLDAEALAAGEVVSGSDGDLVWAAAPVGGRADGPGPGQPVVVATREVSAGFGSAGRWFAVAAVATGVLAVAVARWLADRLTRPVAAAEQVAHRIAAGDLSARVPTDDLRDPELVALAVSVNTMAAELERQRGLERQFLLSVSHDLRTPLTSIRGYAEAIADGAADAHTAAGVILAESRRLERLVQDLLDLARIDAHRFSLDLETVDVADAVAATVDALRPAADDAGVTLALHSGEQPGARRDGPSGEPPAGRAAVAVVDPDRLAQVVANLVENALRFAAARVDVALAADGPWLRITVDDDGPGIPPADLDRVFDRRYTGADRGEGRPIGTGLGLAIARELTHAMGGTVAAGRSPAGGASLTVSLPSGPPG